MKKRNGARSLWMVTCVLLALTGCGDDDGGMVDATVDGSAGADLTFILEAEETITGGLAAGTGEEDILDGWAVTFDKYIVAIGDVDLSFATDAMLTAENAEVYVVDLVQVPSAGLPLWSLGGLREGRWEVSYATPGAADAAMRHESVNEEDFMEMVRGDWTYLIEGTMTKADGESCPPPDAVCQANPTISFRFGVSSETVFGPCQAEDGPSGVAVVPGGSSASLTIHGDHIFFNGFPEGEEGGVMRLAQWLADSDLNIDGTVTREELELIAPADLAELDARYELGGSPITPLDDMWEYLAAQLKTQGHFQGEGECPFDGVEHMHE